MTESNYKMYITAMSSIIKNIDPSIKDLTITGWMRDIAEVFPYYKHTNPHVMAISKYMVQTQPDKFDRKAALDLVKRSTFGYVGKKSTDSVVIDVARYWKKLALPQTQ